MKRTQSKFMFRWLYQKGIDWIAGMPTFGRPKANTAKLSATIQKVMHRTTPSQTEPGVKLDVVPDKAKDWQKGIEVTRADTKLD